MADVDEEHVGYAVFCNFAMLNGNDQPEIKSL